MPNDVALCANIKRQERCSCHFKEKEVDRTDFLPVTKADMDALGWDAPDFVYVCGDAYVDHPSFGAAVICRVLEDAGYRVAFLAQPNFKNTKDFMRFGRPKLAFLVSSGMSYGSPEIMWRTPKGSLSAPCPIT